MVKAKLISYGARLTEFHVPDRHGKTADIVLGFDKVEDYVATNTFFGATCGRYGNRIRNGAFNLNGALVNVGCNEGASYLHGGHKGFDRKIWQTTADKVGGTRIRTCPRPSVAYGRKFLHAS